MEIAASALGAAPMGAGPFQPLNHQFSLQGEELVAFGFMYSAVPFSGVFTQHLKRLSYETNRQIRVLRGPVVGVEK